jgi:hypothetical protein
MTTQPKNPGVRPFTQAGKESRPRDVLHPVNRFLVLAGIGLFVASGLGLGGYCLLAAYTPPPEGIRETAVATTTPEAPEVRDPQEWRRALADLRQRVATPRESSPRPSLPERVVTPRQPIPPRETPESPVSIPREVVPPARSATVNEAIDNGVAFLKGQGDQVGKGPTQALNRMQGCNALIALTLLESGVPVTDSNLASLITKVQNEVPHLNTTYGTSLAILLFDRVGRKEDDPLIRTLALQLAAAQNEAGGWSYGAPPLSPQQQKKLEADLAAKSTKPVGDSTMVEQPPARPRPGQVLPRPAVPQVRMPGDNSNTQFALIALWVARKHGVPVDRPLALVGTHFRNTQNNNGSWAYTGGGGGTQGTDSMTCAGLIGLAVARGVETTEKKAAELTTDPHAEKALRYLGDRLKTIAAQPIPVAGRPGMPPPVAGRPGMAPLPLAGRPGIKIFSSMDDLYCFWSLERMAVLYDLKTVGGVEWHAWGTKHLLAMQNSDGSWGPGLGGPIPSTCFALLFLKRVNLAEDLTANLRLRGKIEDPQSQQGQQGQQPSQPRLASDLPQQGPPDQSSQGLIGSEQTQQGESKPGMQRAMEPKMIRPREESAQPSDRPSSTQPPPKP